MDGEKFDDLLKKVCTTRLTRLGALRGLTVAAAAVVTGSAFVADDASAGHSHKKQAKRKSRSARARHLGDSCRTSGDCAAGEHLFCDTVGETGARRCECTEGFVACGGTCVALSGSGGPLGCSFNASACACECPSTAPICTTSGGTQACVSRTCPSGQTFDEDTCQCSLSCGTNEVFCNGCCHNVSTACAGEHNKNFNAQCCSCENPGQPSGQCKGTPLTCTTT